MSLNSQSTFNDIQREYRECASYDSDGSVPKAKRFVVACRFMLDPMFLQDHHRHGGEESDLTFDRIQAQLEKAQDFVDNGGSIQVPDEGVYHSFERFRD